MKKKRRGSRARGARVAKSDKDIKLKKIDFSDTPELFDRQLSSMRRVRRPTVGDEPRKLIAIRLHAKVLGWLRKAAAERGLPNQSLVNEILAGEMPKAS